MTEFFKGRKVERPFKPGDRITCHEKTGTVRANLAFGVCLVEPDVPMQWPWLCLDFSMRPLATN